MDLFQRGIFLSFTFCIGKNGAESKKKKKHHDQYQAITLFQ